MHTEKQLIRSAVFLSVSKGVFLYITILFLAFIFASDTPWQFAFWGFLAFFVAGFIIWVINSIWGWIIYKFQTSATIKDNFIQQLIKGDFPHPDIHGYDIEDYLLSIINNENCDIEHRLRASTVAGELSSLNSQGLFQKRLMCNIALEKALMEYAYKLNEASLYDKNKN